MKRAAIFLILLFGCQHPQPAPQPIRPASDAAVFDCAGADGRAVCAYCQHMRDLGCPEGQPTQAGVSCEFVTANVQGSFLAMDLACRTATTDCDMSACK